MHLSAGIQSDESNRRELPSEWKTMPLRSVSARITDGEHLTPRRAENGYFLLSARNVLNGKIDLSDVDYVGEAEFQRLRKRCDPQEGDILMSCSGTVGRVALVPRGLQCVLVRSAALIKPDRQAFDGVYGSHFLQSDSAQQQIRVSVNQGAQPNLFLNQIEGLRIVVPPILEQQAIAAALSDADELIERLERLIAKKRAIKEGAMQELLSGHRRLPGFSDRWKEQTFGEVFDFLPTATNARSDLSEEGDTAYVHYGDIHTRFHDTLDFRRTPPPRIQRARCPNAAPLRNGDWIMADASEDLDGVAKSVEVSSLKAGDVAVSGLHTFLLREKKPTFAPGFKGFLGNAQRLREQYLRVMTGMKVFGVSKTALRDLLVPIPNWREQEAIRNVLNDMNDELIALRTRLDKARQIKQGMMQELLTGRVRLA